MDIGHERFFVLQCGVSLELPRWLYAWCFRSLANTDQTLQVHLNSVVGIWY